MSGWKACTAGVLGLLGPTLLAGCISKATTTGAKIKLDTAALSQVRTLRVRVVVANPFSVVILQDAANSTGFASGFLAGGIVGGVAGAIAEGQIRKSADRAEAERLLPKLVGFDCETFLRTELMRELRDTQKFESVVDAGAGEQAANAVLTVEAPTWGLHTGTAGQAEGLAQVAIETKISLVGDAGTPLWERVDYFSAVAPRPRKDFEQDGILRADLEKTVGGYAKRIANEMRYSR